MCDRHGHPEQCRFFGLNFEVDQLSTFLVTAPNVLLAPTEITIHVRFIWKRGHLQSEQTPLSSFRLLERVFHNSGNQVRNAQVRKSPPSALYLCEEEVNMQPPLAPSLFSSNFGKLRKDHRTPEFAVSHGRNKEGYKRRRNYTRCQSSFGATVCPKVPYIS